MHGASNNMELINANQLRLETLSEKTISEANLVNLWKDLATAARHFSALLRWRAKCQWQGLDDLKGHTFNGKTKNSWQF